MSTLFASSSLLTKFGLCCVCKSSVTVNQETDIPVSLCLIGLLQSFRPSSCSGNNDINITT